MGKTGIAWTQQTWNPIAGCSLVSPGCTYCYAMRDAKRVMLAGKSPHYEGVVEEAANGRWVWTGRIGIAPDKKFEEPLRRKTPTIYFVNSMSDLFHPGVPDEVINRVFAIMALTPQHIYQILTKRPERMRDYVVLLDEANGDGRIESICDAAVRITGSPCAANIVEQWLDQGRKNLWLGTSCEDQRRANERIPALLDTPARIRFVSCEPLLGGIEFGGTLQGDWLRATYREKAGEPSKKVAPTLDWVIVGGESGDRARPMHPEWARSIRDQCLEAKVPFFFKQWGSWMPIEIWDCGPPFARNHAIRLDGSMVPDDVIPQDVGGQRFRHMGTKNWDGYDRLDECEYKEFPMSAIVGERV
jgi:protein gp37